MVKIFSVNSNTLQILDAFIHAFNFMTLSSLFIVMEMQPKHETIKKDKTFLRRRR